MCLEPVLQEQIPPETTPFSFNGCILVTNSDTKHCGTKLAFVILFVCRGEAKIQSRVFIVSGVVQTKCGQLCHFITK